MQSAEGLSDRDAAEAVRTRIDWKYLLGLELSDPGFDYSILSRFRDRLIDGHAEISPLQGLLETLQISRSAAGTQPVGQKVPSTPPQ